MRIQLDSTWAITLGAAQGTLSDLLGRRLFFPQRLMKHLRLCDQGFGIVARPLATSPRGRE